MLAIEPLYGQGHSRTMAACRKSAQVACNNPTQRARTQRLRRTDLFRDLSNWRDNRNSKTYPMAPDFLHIHTKDPLRIDGGPNPTWAQDMLCLEKAEASSALMVMHKAQKQSKQNNTNPGIGCKMLSLEEALASLEACMPPLPSVEDFACILHQCRKERNPGHVLRLHACMRERGLETHSSLGNDLVLMLVEAGCMDDARDVFNKLVHPNECSWNSLITGYIKCGESHRALILYQKMREDDSLHPSGRTFVALLKACAKLKDLERGSQIHADIAKKGLLKKDAFIGSTLVDMYAKCGSLAKAREMLDKLPVRDAVSWTALIAGYVEYGRGKEALTCFEQMQHEGVSPDTVTYACSLKACRSIGALDKGQKIHVEISRKGLERHVLVGNTLVDMYAKFGFLAKAQEVFDKLRVRTVVSWTALIAGYADHGRGKEALDYFKQMQYEGIPPDAVTFVCSLKACGSVGATDKGREIHAEIAKKGLENILVASTLVDMYAKSGSLADAQNLFDKLPVRDVVSWTALIAGYVEHGHGEEALHCFDQMQDDGISPDAVTFACSLKACGSIGATYKGREIHVKIAREGLEEDYLVGNTLVDMYAKCGLLAKAKEALDKILVRDVVSWTALITGFVEHGRCAEALDCFEQMQVEGVSPDVVTFVCSLKACGSIRAADKGEQIYAEIAKQGLEGDLAVGSTLVDMYAKCGLLVKAQEVFDKLPVQNVVSWNALIGGFVEHGNGEEALDCFEQMQEEGASPHAVTFLSSLKACGGIGATGTGREIHADITRKGLETDLVVGNTLVDMYSKCGLLAEAQEVFDTLLVRDEVSWNALIAGYAQLGDDATVFSIFERMIGENTKPNLVTFVSVLNVCSHAGLVDKGQMYFEAMSKEFGINPTPEHHTCMVDLLGRAGHVDKSVAMIKKMPFHPGIVAWHTVLGACRKWGNVELGRQAFEHAVRLDETDISAYVSMSNIYADTDRHEDTNEVDATSGKKKLLDLDPSTHAA